MQTVATRRPRFLKRLAGLGLVLAFLSLGSPDASAQPGWYGGYGRSGGFYGRGYGGFSGRGYGPGFYNRGYGLYGPGVYGRGYGGFYGGYGYPYARPYIAPPIYSGFGYGVPGYGYGSGGLGFGGGYPY